MVALRLDGLEHRDGTGKRQPTLERRYRWSPEHRGFVIEGEADWLEAEL